MTGQRAPVAVEGVTAPEGISRGYPPRWKLTTLAELLESGVFIDGDWVESKDQDENGSVRLIQLADVGDGCYRNKSSRFLTKEKAVELRCTFLSKGDVLVARMPEPLGRACIFPGDEREAVTVVDVCILRGDPSVCDQRWLQYAVNSPSFRSSMVEFERGTTRKRISRRNLGQLPFPLPTLEEQNQVVNFIDELISRVTGTRDRLTRVSTLLRRFRQSVLVSACSGQLTADWPHRHRITEPAASLLSRIASERQLKAETIPNEANNVPTHWAITRIGRICQVATGATPLRRRSDYYRGTIPWVTSSAVNQGLVTQADETITELAIKETNAKVFPKGTLLVAMYGEGQTRGRVAELGIDAATNQALAALLFSGSNVGCKDFLRLHFLKTYGEMRELAAGGVQPNLSLGLIRESEILLPPLEEQAEIVRRVSELFAIADSVESRLTEATALVERTTKAILAKAFRGELP